MYVFQREYIQNKKLQSTDDITRLNLSENSTNKEHVETLKPQLHPRITVKRQNHYIPIVFCYQRTTQRKSQRKFFLTQQNTVNQYTVCSIR